MVDLPLDRLLQIAEADRQKNEDAFQATAKQIDAEQAGRGACSASLQLDHPPASTLLKTTQDTLDSLRQFIVDHHIITIPPSDPAHVKETPPFMRSTTSASMDTPGPFETAKLDGVLQHDAARSAHGRRRRRTTTCASWYYAAIVERVGARGVSGPLHPVPVREELSVRRAQGVRRARRTSRAGRTTASR